MALPQAQELTEYITIVDTSPESSATGKREASGSMIATAWARITEGGGTTEPTDQQHEGQTQEFEVITQYIEGVRAWHSILWGSRQLDIVEPPQKIFDPKHRAWLVMRAEEYIERSF